MHHNCFTPFDLDNCTMSVSKMGYALLNTDAYKYLLELSQSGTL